MVKRSGGDTNVRLRFACVQPLRHLYAWREMLSYALYATKAFDTRVLEKFG